MRDRKEIIHKYIKKRNYDKAIKEMLLMVETNPTVSNYCFVSEMAKGIDFSRLNFVKLKIAILCSFTIEPIIPYLRVKCYQSKIEPEINLAGYNLVQQEIFAKDSELYKFSPDVVIIAIRPQELCPKLVDFYLELSKENVNKEVKHVLNTIDSLLSIFRNRSSAKVILHNFELPKFPALGILDSQLAIGQKRMFEKINSKLTEIVQRYSDVYILDYDYLQSIYGRLNWFDEKLWYLARLPISNKGLASLANEYIKYFKPMKRLNKKCLVLDLDNTLWGGILGEDGFDGIQLGPEYPGSAFVDFQKSILNLYNRGIILTINSNNNKDDVMEVFEKHPYMVLCKKYFATMEINWNNKVLNMKKIANVLNIGLDSFVFMDDSQFNCELIRKELPEILTIQLPSDPIYYCKTLLNISDFETLTYSIEDMKRGKLYQAQVERKKLKEKAGSLESFYLSLEMKVTIGMADKYSIPRVSQLTQKTNQFNLTTRRYSESDIKKLAHSDSSEVFYLHLKDRLSDEGIISVAIIKKQDDIWEIDTFLLSCRVIGRTVETAFLTFLIDKAKKEKVKYVYGKYIPTKKNNLVRDFYKKHKFKLITKNNRETRWKVDVQNFEIHYSKWFSIDIV